MSSLNPGAASFNVNSQTLQFQMTLDPTSNPVVAGDVVTLLNSGNVRRADNGTVVPYTFDSNTSPSSSNTISAVALSTTVFVVVYSGANNYLYAVIGTVSGNAITYGTPLALNAAVSTNISVCALSSTSFVVGYTSAATYIGLVCTVSGSVITAGTPATIYASNTSYGGVSALSSSAFVAAYTGPSSYVNAVVCSVSGTTITVNTPVALNAVSSSYTCVAALSSTTFAVGYVVTSNNFVNAVVCTIIGTTITGGTPAVLNAVSSSTTRIAALDATDFVVAYVFSSSSIAAIVCSVSVTTITAGTPVTILTNAATGTCYPALCGISSTQFYVSGRGGTTSTYYLIQAAVCSQSGNVITAGTQTTVVYDSGTSAPLPSSACLLMSGQVVVAYAATENRAISVPFSGNVITYPGIAVNNTIGVASSSATGGNNLNVVSIGVTATNIQYTLTIGTQYYWDSTFGRPTTVAYSYALGIALNTQLLLVARVTGTNQYFG